MNPVVRYFPRSPWGFRWIHHELEAMTYRVREQGNPNGESAALHIFAVNVSPESLEERETEEIAKERVKHGPAALANGKPCMAHQDRNNLDRAWV
jgi:hypothetical protein